MVKVEIPKKIQIQNILLSMDLNLLLSSLDFIDMSKNYPINMRIALKKGAAAKKDSKKEPKKGLAKKLLPKKKEKDDDLVIIIDKSEKHKEKLDKQIESITLKMDGFEKIHLEQYQKQLEQYQRFLAEYLKDSNNVLKQGYNPYEDKDNDKKEREFKWGQEVVTYFEIKDIARRIQMNALLSGNTNGAVGGHNHVGWQEAEDYKFWKYCSKFNELMSFIFYDNIGAG